MEIGWLKLSCTPGVGQIENEDHHDFVKLQEMLIYTNMEDLQEQTHTTHYELYRSCQLEEMGLENKPLRLQETYEAKRHRFSLSFSHTERKKSM